MYYLDKALPFLIVWRDCKDDVDYLECSHLLNAPYELVPIGRRMRKDRDPAFMQYCFKSENLDEIIERACLEAL